MSLTNLKSAAQKATSLSELMNGREQLTTAQVENQTLTPIAVDIASVNGKKFPVFVFAEAPDRYYNGGLILEKIVEAWVADADGDLSAVNDELANNSGDIRFRFRTGHTKDGTKNLTTVDII